MTAPIRLEASIFSRWMSFSGVSLASRTRRRRSLSVTSAARVISASAAPKRMADSRFHAARGDHHAVVAEGAAGDRRRLVVARMMDRGHGCDLAGREPGLLKYRCLGPAADDQMAFGA